MKYRSATISAAVSALMVLCLSVSASLADEVYKSVDAQGHVVYSDRATTPAARKSAVHVIQGDPVEAARAAKQTSTLEAEEQLRKHEQAAEANDRARQDRDRQVRCENARNSYFSLQGAGVLYRMDAQGNRQFYTDTEADARRERARQAMLAACGK